MVYTKYKLQWKNLSGGILLNHPKALFSTVLRIVTKC